MELNDKTRRRGTQRAHLTTGRRWLEQAPTLAAAIGEIRDAWAWPHDREMTDDEIAGELNARGFRNALGRPIIGKAVTKIRGADSYARDLAKRFTNRRNHEILNRTNRADDGLDRAELLAGVEVQAAEFIRIGEEIVRLTHRRKVD